ncbi:hypothetical protein B0H13DRAFT_1852299 [Mycena leptocephala]|nr:hypothetical protein B0H13DRAFT_1852299 [Mycena leptocephala]
MSQSKQSEVVRARVVLFLAAPAGGIVSASLTTPPATAQARRPGLIGGCWEHRPERAGSASECATAPPAAGCRCTFARAAIYGMEYRDARLRATGAAAGPVTVPASPQGSRSAEVCGVSRNRRGRRHIWRQVDTAVEGEVAEFFESRRGGGSIRGDSPYGDKSQGVWVLLTGPKVEPERTGTFEVSLPVEVFDERGVLPQAIVANELWPLWQRKVPPFLGGTVAFLFPIIIAASLYGNQGIKLIKAGPGHSYPLLGIDLWISDGENEQQRS